MPVKISIDKNWSSKKLKQFDAALLEMAVDIHRRAVMLAPRDTGALANSGEVTKVPSGYQVKFGSGKVPYARLRHFENKKNPQTLGYLAKAGDSVSRGDKGKYFRGKV